MAHAIKLLVATANAPSDAQQRWGDWRTDPTCTATTSGPDWTREATVGTTGVP